MLDMTRSELILVFYYRVFLLVIPAVVDLFVWRWTIKHENCRSWSSGRPHWLFQSGRSVTATRPSVSMRITVKKKPATSGGIALKAFRS